MSRNSLAKKNLLVSLENRCAFHFVWKRSLNTLKGGPDQTTDHHTHTIVYVTGIVNANDQVKDSPEQEDKPAA